MEYFVCYVAFALLLLGGLCVFAVRQWRRISPVWRVVLVMLATIPVIPYVRIELLTLVHADEARAILNTMDDVFLERDVSYFRVFRWSPGEVRILVVLRHPGEGVWDRGTGLMLVERRDGLAERTLEAVWSRTGSADSTTWPPYP